jgi:16S rRNA (uracil1498-N3)-methyltransferase
MSAVESRHAIGSWRVKMGEEVMLFDGAGREAVGLVASVGRRLEVEVTEIQEHPFDMRRRLTLVVAMPKTHRQGYLIEKCTELGVAAVWPIVADRSVTKPRPGAAERWSRRAIEATKQSCRRWVPMIAAPMTVGESIGRIGEFGAAGLTDVDPLGKPLPSFFSALPESSSVIVWVGPEGGWTDIERDQAIEAGAMKVKLGPTVLRTETAAAAVCAVAAVV